MTDTPGGNSGNDDQAAFWKMWGPPIFVGVGAGFLAMTVSGERIAEQYEGPAATLATCAVGFVVSFVTIIVCRVVVRVIFGK